MKLIMHENMHLYTPSTNQFIFLCSLTKKKKYSFMIILLILWMLECTCLLLCIHAITFFYERLLDISLEC